MLSIEVISILYDRRNKQYHQNGLTGEHVVDPFSI